jgi:dTDP-glucose 4,6-dehydratase
MLVTGGAGFIGTNFVRYWSEQHPHDEIVVLDALTYAARRENLADLENEKKITFIEGDICDSAVVKGCMEGVDTVVHFAAESHVDRSISGPAAFIKTNITGTFILLEAARDAKVKRFHHISTDEVFGSLPADPTVKFSESTPYDPRSPYSASKASSDHLVRAYFHTFGVPVTISNCSNNYGPYQFPEKFIPVQILKALRGEKLPVYGDGSNIRDWIHVLDHARGIEAILLKGKAGETYCLGGDAEKTNLEVSRAILQELGLNESHIEFVTDRPGHDHRYAIDFSKATRELGWKPQITFEEGLRHTVAWYTQRKDEYRPQEEGVHAHM